MTKLRLYLISGILYFSAALLVSSKAASQPMPPFKMMLSDNKVFAAVNLPKGKPVVLIYFDPECDHCQKLMKELFKKISSFKKAEIVMVTFKSITEVSTFEKEYNTVNFGNIRVGTEGGYFYLRNYYELIKMPFTALYDRKQNLSYSYRQETPVDDLIKRLNNLK